MMRPCMLALVLLAGVPAFAHADSDYYYCAGPGYIAYESRLENDPPGHRLHVVRFSRSGGITALPPIALEDFQVHTMTCGATTVELRSSRTVYTVDVFAATPRVASRPARSGETRPEPALNLGHWARPGIVDLASDGAMGEFQLVIARVERAIEGGLERVTISDVVRREPGPASSRILASRRVFEGIFFESVH